MSTLLEHRGYIGSVEYSDEDEVFFGRLEFIRDLVTYEGADAKSLKAAFHDAVGDYLETCAAEGKTPELPLKGSFNVRPGHELHRRAMIHAKRKGINLNAVVSDALRNYLDSEESRA
jgi:predicted HicB family RNase H-like nuclease